MKPKIVIIHHSATRDSGTVSWGAIRRYHTETLGWDAIGYSYGLELIGNHYEILVGRMMNEPGAHTKGHNHNSLGICFIGNYDKDEVPPEMWDLGIRFISSLCQIVNINPVHIYGHREFADYKSCPGKRFNTIMFRAQIQEAIREST